MRNYLLVLPVFVLIAFASHASIAIAAEESTFSAATTAADGVLVHAIKSEYQAGATDLRVLMPDDRTTDERFPVVFVLPVEAGRENRYGDGLVEVQKHDLHNKHRAIFVAPSFFHLPWYADHGSDNSIAQESYFRTIVLFVAKTYPVVEAKQRFYLLGFSKSGWGAVSLLLRDPKSYARAAAWDAPLMMDRLGKYGTTPIFGDEKTFAKYALPAVVKELYDPDQYQHRFVLTGYGGFRTEMTQFHDVLNKHGIKDVYRDGPERKHDWHSGWVPEAVALLLAPAK